MNDVRPRILIIKPILPYPPNQGSRVLTFGLIKALRDRYDVTVLARILSKEELREARALEAWCTRVVTVLAPNRKSFFHRVFYKVYFNVLSTFFRRSLKTLYDCPGALVRAAQRLAEEPFDLVVLDYWQLAPLLDVFPPERTVLLTLDIDLLINRRVSLLERHLVKKLQAVNRWLLEQKEEVAAYRRARHVWTLTERDKTAVQTISRDRAEVEVMPFGIDVDFFTPSGMARMAGEVLFIGHMGAAFNRDALAYFAEKIFPNLAQIDGLSITVVGGDLPRELANFALQPEVEIVGRVPDVRPYLHRASCLVVPLRFGGGLRIRILEAMAAGLPVVTTTVGIAGMPYEAEKDYLRGETPEELAGQIGRVLGDAALGEALARSARARTVDEYGLAAQRDRLRALVDRFVSNSDKTPKSPENT